MGLKRKPLSAAHKAAISRALKGKKRGGHSQAPYEHRASYAREMAQVDKEDKARRAAQVHAQDVEDIAARQKEEATRTAAVKGFNAPYNAGGRHGAEMTYSPRKGVGGAETAPKREWVDRSKPAVLSKPSFSSGVDRTNGQRYGSQDIAVLHSTPDTAKAKTTVRMRANGKNFPATLTRVVKGGDGHYVVHAVDGQGKTHKARVPKGHKVQTYM